MDRTGNPEALRSFRPRVVLICHEGSEIALRVLKRWLDSMAQLVGVVVIRESAPAMSWLRARKEFKRAGFIGFLDVLAYRLYYRIFLARKEHGILQRMIESCESTYPALTCGVPEFVTSDPNSGEVQEFVRAARPDFAIAYCKHLLREAIYAIPKSGTFALHPGKCPEYRNAHGCFWALVNEDDDKVLLTLLRIDDGVDTGPVFGYFSSDFDPLAESHALIQDRNLLENLGQIGRTLLDICADRAVPISTVGSASGIWGQPRLSGYLRYRRRLRKGAQGEKNE